MISRKTFNRLHGQLETKFRRVRNLIDELKLEDDASTSIHETLDAQYLVQVKALHDMDEPVNATPATPENLDEVFGKNGAEASPNV